MKTGKPRILFLLLAVALICSVLISCGGNSNKNNGDTPGSPTEKQNDADSGGGASETITEETYVYQDYNGGGADFTFLNPDATSWFYYKNLVFEESQADILDDAVYKRNRFIEDKFNITIKATDKNIGDIYSQLKKVISAGTDEYQAAFAPAFHNGNIGALITANMFYNLRDVSTINLDAKWWNQTMLKEASVGSGNKAYYAGCGINIMTLQCVSCIYFNQDMMYNLGLELPYNSVREGKWTLDLFHQYMKSGTNLNGAESFKWVKGGTAIYGFTGYEDAATALLMGSGESFIITDKDGTPQLNITSERFMNVVNKLVEMLTVKGDYLYANNESSGEHYEPIFMDGRALLTLGELKAANRFRTMESTFGVLPIPKYEEKQPDYYCHLIFGTPLLVIPSSNPQPEFAGAVLDAMAYVSDRDVTPVLFDVSVSQKQLRNEDSIEMLQLIKNSGSFDVGSAYGWTLDFYNGIAGGLGKGNKYDIVSQVEKQRDKIIAKIEKTMDLFD